MSTYITGKRKNMTARVTRKSIHPAVMTNVVRVNAVMANHMSLMNAMTTMVADVVADVMEEIILPESHLSSGPESLSLCLSQASL